MNTFMCEVQPQASQYINHECAADNHKFCRQLLHDTTFLSYRELLVAWSIGEVADSVGKVKVKWRIARKVLGGYITLTANVSE